MKICNGTFEPRLPEPDPDPAEDDPKYPVPPDPEQSPDVINPPPQDVPMHAMIAWE